MGYTPGFLRSQIRELKEGLKDKSAPFGVDLLIPRAFFFSSVVLSVPMCCLSGLQLSLTRFLLFPHARRAEVGGTARKTNRDYTEGKLPELIDIIIEEKAALFVCAIGVPPKEAIDKLHK